MPDVATVSITLSPTTAPAANIAAAAAAAMSKEDTYKLLVDWPRQTNAHVQLHCSSW
jgi:hypothetical protein